MSRKDIIAAATAIVDYCNMFDADNENRRSLMSQNKLPEGVKDFSEAFQQLENHREQENRIATIRSFAKEILLEMERITYLE